MTVTRIINAKNAQKRWYSLVLSDGHITSVELQTGPVAPSPGVKRLEAATDVHRGPDQTWDAGGDLLIPAGVDIHIHSRDPGLTHKEDWTSVARGGARGGVAAVVDMPNTIPATMTRETVLAKAERAQRSGIGFRLFLGVGRSNVNQLATLLTDPSLPLAGVKVYYGQSTGDLMFADLQALDQVLPRGGGKLLVFHSEDQCCIDDNTKVVDVAGLGQSNVDYAIHSKLRDSRSAWTATQAILDWAIKSRRSIHIAHVSTPREVEMIADARIKGAHVTCEVAPHHLLLSTDDYPRLGPFLKVNPPVRSPEEVAALRLLVKQGCVDAFATDHAPHTRNEKLQPYARCPSGMPSLEWFYPLIFRISDDIGLARERAVNMASTRPAELVGLSDYGALEPGRPFQATLIREGNNTISEHDVVSKCGWTPYDGLVVPVKVLATWHGGTLMGTQK